LPSLFNLLKKSLSALFLSGSSRTSISIFFPSHLPVYFPTAQGFNLVIILCFLFVYLFIIFCSSSFIPHFSSVCSSYQSVFTSYYYSVLFRVTFYSFFYVFSILFVFSSFFLIASFTFFI
jgi:hypothetical protein